MEPWELASLGFPSLQHLPEWGVHFSGVCLAPFVALSGFVYPLSGLLLPKPLEPLFQVQAFLGLTPSESFPFEELNLSRGRLLSCPWTRLTRPTWKASPGLQSLFPFEEPSTHKTSCYTGFGADPLLGFSISGEFHPDPVDPLGPTPLLYFPFAS